MRVILVIGCIIMTFSKISYAQQTPNIVQEEESAEVFLEEYTDEFQNTFFEALKQKSIQNYDRAINLLLDCKRLQPQNTVLDHELAKTHFLDKNYIAAQQYAVEAVIATPENYWFLDNLVRITKKQGAPFQSLQNTIPYSNEVLRSNLIKILFQNKNYAEAKAALKGVKMTTEFTKLEEEINRALHKPKQATKSNTSNQSTVLPSSSENLELSSLKKALKVMVNNADYNTLETRADQAIQTYPLQPEFYYYRGLALHKMKRSREAITVMEEGLAYLFDNDDLENEFYKELAKAHNALGNSSKANDYLSKIKSRF